MGLDYDLHDESDEYKKKIKRIIEFVGSFLYWEHPIQFVVFYCTMSSILFYIYHLELNALCLASIFALIVTFVASDLHRTNDSVLLRLFYSMAVSIT